MKLPRWLMIAMLTSSVLAVLAAAGWWWVTWPERTAREFLILAQEGRWVEAGRMYGSKEVCWDPQLDEEQKEFVRSLRLEMVHPREWIDIGRARQGFRLFKPDGKQNSVLRAEKGSILEGDWGDSNENYPIQ